MTSPSRPGKPQRKASSPSSPGRQAKAQGFRDVVPNVRDHGVKPPPKSEIGRKGEWVFLSVDLHKMYLSHFARFGDWSETVKACYVIPPAIQEEAEALRRQFLAHPRHQGWLGDFPGDGT
jgi:hypothetical protein